MNPVPNFHTAVCLHFCFVVNDRGVASCICMQLLIDSCWKLLSLKINLGERGRRRGSKRPHRFIVLTDQTELSLEVDLQAHA